MGDLNEVIDDSEKLGGRAVWRKHLYLKNFFLDSGGIDLRHSGKLFTWDNGQGGMVSIRERLDRGVADHAWMLQFPKASVEHFTSECSDHCPILLNTWGQESGRRRPFRFLEAWASDPSSHGVVEKAWDDQWRDGMDCHQLRKSLFNTSKALKTWNIEHFGMAQTKINSLEEELNSI